MSAIVRKMVVRCTKLFCNRAGSYEVITPLGTRCGPYCRKCANQIADELDRAQEKRDAGS